jgi:hypothetical protein
LLIYDVYPWSLLVALPCVHVVWPYLVHLFYFSSFCICSFLTVVSSSLKILYSFFYTEYINCIDLNFPLLPSTSHGHTD